MDVPGFGHGDPVFGDDGNPIVGMGTAAIVPLPGHPDGSRPGEMIGVKVTIENFTHPEEALVALAMFGQEFQAAYEAGAIAQADVMAKEIGLDNPVEVDMSGARRAGLCEEHAAEAADKMGASTIGEAAEAFLRDLAGD